MPEDIEACKRAGLVTLACNDNWIYEPDMLYAPDQPWIFHHKGVPTHHNKWTPTQNVLNKYPDWNYIRIESEAGKPGLSWDPSIIHHGSNAGYQMLNIAALAGANPIILLGYDMQPTYGKIRWKGQQAKGVEKGNVEKFGKWIQQFSTTVPELEQRGITVINCTRATALNCFARGDLHATLASLCGDA